MPVDRPTFSETWYRVADLRPRLRVTVNVYRQHFRHQMWWVIQDPSSNQFFRVNEGAYRFIAMLDGRRTVARVWKVCNELFGDASPTQGEAIQLLGQLYGANLLQAELPPDAEGLFKRYEKRVSREVKGYLTNILFIRIPIIDPDGFLNEFLPAVRWVYSWIGLVLLGVLVCLGAYSVIERADELVDQAKNVLDPSRLPLLFVSFWVVKIFHEFSHSFACKKFARDSGTRGEVHTMGIMLLVFTPMPYMDASSAWAFRSKWKRVLVNAAGMLVELGIASIAAIVWAKTSPGTTVHAVAYNVMFIASVSTLLFNANPLLRYDGYYILADLLEIANLQQRSRQYIYYLVRKYVWRIRRARSPANTKGERFWFVFYGIASTIYRFFIVTAILLFVAGVFPFVGMVIAIGAGIVMLLVPVGKFFKYLLTNNELTRVRTGAITSVVLVLGAIVALVGLIRVPDRSRIEGIVEPEKVVIVTPLTDGFVRSFLVSDRYVTPESDVLIEAENPAKEAQLAVLLCELDAARARKRKADTESVAAAQTYKKVIAMLDKQIRDVRDELEALKLHPPMAGRWISPQIERLEGAYVQRGQQIGLLASREMVIVAVVKQDVGPRAFEEVSVGSDVEIRIRNRPDLDFGGTIIELLPAARKDLPSRALGYAIGGTVQTVPDDPEGLEAVAPFFLIRIAPDDDSDVKLLSGQRVVVRLTTPSKPLGVQWWRGILQLVQRRFHG